MTFGGHEGGFCPAVGHLSRLNKNGEITISFFFKSALPIRSQGVFREIIHNICSNNTRRLAYVGLFALTAKVNSS